MKTKTTIFIKDLVVDCYIGVSDEERNKKQTIIINAAFDIDYKSAKDSIDSTVNYKILYQEILKIVGSSHFNLLESLCQKIIDYSFEFPQIMRATIRIEKPEKFPNTKSVGVEMTQER